MNGTRGDREEVERNRASTPRRSSSPRRRCLDVQAQDFGLLIHPYRNHPLMEHVRSQLKSRGPVGFSELQRALKDFDAQGKLALTREAFGVVARVVHGDITALAGGAVDAGEPGLTRRCGHTRAAGAGILGRVGAAAHIRQVFGEAPVARQ